MSLKIEPNKREFLIDKSTDSDVSTLMKSAFLEWIINRQLKKIEPENAITTLEKASEQLLRRKITHSPLWEINNYEVYKEIYYKAINDKLFKLMDKKTYTTFAKIGKEYMKLLKSRPRIFMSSDEHINNMKKDNLNMTIKDAVACVLENEQLGMTAEQIYYKIIEENLYSFGAQNPIDVVRVQIDRACSNSNYSIRSSNSYFRFQRNQKGEKIYFLISEDSYKSGTPIELVTIVDEMKQKTNDNAPFDFEIWNHSIEREFMLWVESKYPDYMVKNYNIIINQIIHKVKPFFDIAARNASSTPEAIHRFADLLHKNSEYIDDNITNMIYPSVALDALIEFHISCITDECCRVQNEIDQKLKHIVDLNDGIKGIRDILNSHFNKLHSYSNIGILWSAAQNSLSMFLNDNAINSSEDLWDFLVVAFKNEFIFNPPHIWEKPPSYPHNSKGMVMNLAHQNNGVVSRAQIDEFFTKIKLTTLSNSTLLDKGQLLFYDKGKFILTETINLNVERCMRITKALDNLFTHENTIDIILRDISLMWYTHLPELPNNYNWTPLLLQETLRICPNIGYRIISPNLKGQNLDTLGSAIVKKQSELVTFSDFVHKYMFDKYKLPIRISSEDLRLELRSVGALDGNELIYNMHKALKDHRFAFSDNNQSVLILER